MDTKHFYLKGEIHSFLLDLETLTTEGMEILIEKAFKLGEGIENRDVFLIQPNHETLVLQVIDNDDIKQVEVFNIKKLNAEEY